MTHRKRPRNRHRIRFPSATNQKKTFNLEWLLNDLDFLIPVVCLYPSFEVLGIWLFNNFVAACVELAISLAIFAFGVTAEAQEIRPGEESCLPQLILIVILGWGGVPFLALMLGNLPVLIWILRVPALAVVGYIVVQLSQAIFDEIRK